MQGATTDGRRGDASPAHGHHHQVEFYEADEFLVDSVCGFLEPALVAGDAVIVVATEAHRQKFTAELEGRGIDVRAARTGGRFFALDAGETLALFMVDGTPDPDRFAHEIGELVDRAADGRRRVRIYGEMVALLWAEGDIPAAIALEDLWNDLAGTRRFSLLCAYPMVSFAGASSTAPFRRMCQQHTGVTPTESFSRLVDRDDQSYAVALLQQEAAAASNEAAVLRAQHTELVAAAREVAAARDHAVAASRAMSHSLRAPIDELMALTEALRPTPLDDHQRAVVDGVNAAATVLLGTIDDIADLCRLDGGGLELDMSGLHLGRLLEEVRALAAPLARARRLELVTDCDPALPPARRGDVARLRRVLVQLVSHIVKAAERGQVVVRARPATAGQVRFEVVTTTLSHDGEQLLDGFVHADLSAAPAFGERGLGLSASRRLVQAMGGRTGLEPDPGRGCTVWLTLPLPVDWFDVPLPAAPDATPRPESPTP